MSEITAASQEQTAGIDQINMAITQMDQVTQQNAALVEQAAAAAASLEDQASKLAQTVSIFKIHGGMAAAESKSVSKAKPAPLRHRTSAPKRAAASRVTAVKTPKAETKKTPHAVDDWEEF
jgi:uncharacterized phage infection (PIP) family protein YhgE